ncbi:MAG: hypothetical protein LBM99_03720, partial [Bacillales bacterium]|nr:hypothetical protein [Bacillales bacterium]
MKKKIIYSSIVATYLLSLLLAFLIKEKFLVFLSCLLFSLGLFSLLLVKLLFAKTSKIDILRRLFLLIASFNLVLFIALRSMWWGIQKTLGVPNLHYLLLILLIAVVILSLFDNIKKFPNWLVYLYVALTSIFYLLIYYIVDGSLGSIIFVTKDFFEIILIIAFIVVIVSFIRFLPKFNKMKVLKKITLSSLVAILLALLIDFSLVRISVKPVVYAVEDEYQIVWSTTSEASGVVKVGHQEFYDNIAGGQTSNKRIHKVIIPM